MIWYEHKFLRNIEESVKQIEESDHMKNLESHIMTCIGLLALLNNFNRHDFSNLANE